MTQSFTSFKFPMKSNLDKKYEQKANFSVKAETTLMLDNINNWDTFNSKRINASLNCLLSSKIFRRHWILCSILSRYGLL